MLRESVNIVERSVELYFYFISLGDDECSYIRINLLDEGFLFSHSIFLYFSFKNQ